MRQGWTNALRRMYMTISIEDTEGAVQVQLGFERHTKGELAYYTVPALERTGLVRHCFTTRRGGVSTGETATLNLGFRRKDTYENVRRNYEIVCSAIGMKAEDLVLSNQVHDNRVRVITRADCGKGITRESDIVGIDALVCAEPGVPFVVFCADCVPVFFLDPVRRVAALAHSGWRSTVKNISGEVLAVMRREFGCDMGDVLCAVGPSIGQCCFEVDGDVAEQFPARFTEPRGAKYHVDLWGVIHAQLRDAGVKEDNITLAGICTCCNGDEFFSNRADKGKIGLMGAFLELK